VKKWYLFYMEKYLTKPCDNIEECVASECLAVMPSGRVGVCCLSKDRKYAESVVSGISQFEYKFTFIEYPDEVEPSRETALDVVNSDDDIRFFVAVGDCKIASIMALASLSREIVYVIAVNTPDICGVGYSIDCEKGFTPPICVYADKVAISNSYRYCDLVASVFGHRVDIIEKKYVNYLSRRFDERKLVEEEELLDKIIGDGNMSDRKRIFDGIVEYSALDREEFNSAHKIMSKLLEEASLAANAGDCKLLSAITLLKYFKIVLSVEEYYLTIPIDISVKCRKLAKLLGVDISEIICKVKDRKFQNKWLFIHGEYRQDLLDEVIALENKMKNIIKSAKRYMEDVGYHLGEDFQSGLLLDVIYNLSPLTDDCSLVTLADIL
ncbi:MAG: hypothetical protein K2G37_04230, partial [Clostridia bacterium]|nr:hypothetical protein [Clostridia bacterium]